MLLEWAKATSAGGSRGEAYKLWMRSGTLCFLENKLRYAVDTLPVITEGIVILGMAILRRGSQLFGERRPRVRYVEGVL